MFQDLDKSETISETSTIKDEDEMEERGSDDDVVHVECSLKTEQKEQQAMKSNDGAILEAAVQEHQMSNIQENHQITILKLRVLGKLSSTKIFLQTFFSVRSNFSLKKNSYVTFLFIDNKPNPAIKTASNKIEK